MIEALRHRVVGDVVEEGMPGLEGTYDGDRRAGIALVQPVGEHDLRKTVGAGDEVAVGVGCQQRHVGDVGVLECDAQQVPVPAP